MPSFLPATTVRLARQHWLAGLVAVVSGDEVGRMLGPPGQLLPALWNLTNCFND